MWKEIAILVESGDTEKAIEKAYSVKNKTFFSNSRNAGSILMKLWHDFIKGKSAEEIAAEYPHVQRILISLYKNINSLHKNSIEWRKPIAAAFGKYSEVYRKAIYELGISKEESLERRESYQREVRERLKTRQETIEEGRIYEIIDYCYQSAEFFENIIAIMLATGSRLVEVLKISKFMPIPEEPQKIHIFGMAKGQNDKNVIRPLIRLNSEQILDLITHIRRQKNFADMSEEEASSAACAGVNGIIRKIIGSEYTSHKLRYIWASLAWELYGGNSPQQEWVRSMFMHESADTTTTYLLYKIRITPEVRNLKKYKIPLFLRECGNMRNLKNSERFERIRNLQDRGILINEEILLDYGYPPRFLKKMK